MLVGEGRVGDRRPAGRPGPRRRPAAFVPARPCPGAGTPLPTLPHKGGGIYKSPRTRSLRLPSHPRRWSVLASLRRRQPPRQFLAPTGAQNPLPPCGGRKGGGSAAAGRPGPRRRPAAFVPALPCPGAGTPLPTLPHKGGGIYKSPRTSSLRLPSHPRRWSVLASLRRRQPPPQFLAPTGAHNRLPPCGALVSTQSPVPCNVG